MKIVLWFPVVLEFSLGPHIASQVLCYSATPAERGVLKFDCVLVTFQVAVTKHLTGSRKLAVAIVRVNMTFWKRSAKRIPRRDWTKEG